MWHWRVWLALAGSMLLTAAANPARRPLWPDVHYLVRVDSASGQIDVTMTVADIDGPLKLGMQVHPFYNSAYWTQLAFVPASSGLPSGFRERSASIQRLDSTLWRMPAAPAASVHWVVHAPSGTERPAWQTVVRPDGALLNPPDLFLYLVDHPAQPVSVDLDVPRSWKVVTSLQRDEQSGQLLAPDAATLLDSPILLGDVRTWTFRDRGTSFIAAYWPLPGATAFDTLSLVDELRRIAGAALDVFRTTPTDRYVFLLQDGADDALEHRASVTIGLPSADLARDPRTHLQEITHEFFHAWNLIAIHPDSFMTLLYRHPPPTTGLWWGEGITLHYADVLPRRAGLRDSTESRVHHIEALLSYYARAPWATEVSPEAASLAADSSLLATANATGSYYVQGELLANVLDALVRDSTGERRTLDDVMRSLYARSRARSRASSRGLTSRDWELIADSACGCDLHGFFENDVRRPGRIALDRAMARLGWRIVVDTVPAVNDAGEAIPDLRVRGIPSGATMRLLLNDPASAWALTGLTSGDVVRAIDGQPVDGAFMSFYGPLRRHHIGDSVIVDVLHDGASKRVVVALTGYTRPQARLVDAPTVTAEQRERRHRWMTGW